MVVKIFPTIDLEATGKHISELRRAKGLSVRDLQEYFGFEAPQAIYKWQKGTALPTVDNLLALSVLLDVPMDSILVRAGQVSRANEPSGSFFMSRIREKSEALLNWAKTRDIIISVGSVCRNKMIGGLFE